jgi:hypothetical protein
VYCVVALPCDGAGAGSWWKVESSKSVHKCGELLVQPKTKTKCTGRYSTRAYLYRYDSGIKVCFIKNTFTTCYLVLVRSRNNPTTLSWAH